MGKWKNFGFPKKVGKISRNLEKIRHQEKNSECGKFSEFRKKLHRLQKTTLSRITLTRKNFHNSVNFSTLSEKIPNRLYVDKFCQFLDFLGILPYPSLFLCFFFLVCFDFCLCWIVSWVCFVFLLCVSFVWIFFWFLAFCVCYAMLKISQVHIVMRLGNL